MSLNDPATLYLSRVLPAPSGGYLNLHWAVPNPHDARRPFFRGQACADVKEAASWARWADRRDFDVYVCMSEQSQYDVQKTGTVNKPGVRVAHRNADNATKIKALYIDCDVKSAHKKGDNAYDSQKDALRAVYAMCVAEGFPRPTLFVSSGYGIHFYWVLDQELTLVQWAPLAHSLVQMAHAHGILFDSGCTVDAARLLRVPGTHNYKDRSSPQPVTLAVKSVQPDDCPVAQVAGVLSKYTAVAPPLSRPDVGLPPAGPPIEDDGEFSAGVAEHKAQPVNAEALFKSCAVLGQAQAENGATYERDLWKLVVNATTFLPDGEKWAHELSRGWPAYNPDEVSKEYQEALAFRQKKDAGWPRCATFARHRPSACHACPNFSQGKSPLNFARDDGDLPPRFFRRNGVIWMRAMREGEPVEKVVWRYGARDPRLEDTPKGVVFSFTALTAGNESRRVEIPVGAVSAGGQTMATVLGKHGLAISKHDQGPTGEFLVAWIQTLQAARATTRLPHPFGWSEQGFAYGGVLLRGDGTRGDVASFDNVLARQYAPKGDLQGWRAAADVITDQKRPALEAILAAAFAGPLVPLFGQHGLLMSAFSTESGIGKSSAMRVAQAVWGHPTEGMQSLNDTPASVIHKVGLLRNLPMFWDELKGSAEIDKFVVMAFQLTQGKEKSRLTSEVQFREAGTFSSLITVASNDSVLDYMHAAVKSSAAGIYRVFEFDVAPAPPTMSVLDASRTFSSLDTHHGQAGLTYSKFLAENKDFAKGLISKVYGALDKRVQFQADERFWAATMSTLVAGAVVAKKLNLADFHIAELTDFLILKLGELRTHRKNQPVDVQSADTIASILSRYLQNLATRHLLVTDKLWRGGTGRPRVGAVSVRCDGAKLQGVRAQLAVDDGILRLNTEDFSDWLQKERITRKAVFAVLQSRHGATMLRGVLGSGTPFSTVFAASCIDLDLRHPSVAGMIDVDDLITVDGEVAAETPA